MRTALGRAVAYGLLVACIADAALADVPPTEREVYTCQDEAKKFAAWSKGAGRLQPSEIERKYSGIRVVEMVAGDGRRLRGVTTTGVVRKDRALLVIGGNAWSIDGFLDYTLPHFKGYTVDIYFFDHRGYGLSTPAVPSMKAMLTDYAEIAAWLRGEGYQQLHAYGASFGGVIATAALGRPGMVTHLVIDGTPSRGSDYKIECSPPYITAEFLPSDCSSMTLMHGTGDWIVSRERAQELIDTATKCGARLDIDKPRWHPFQIEWDSSRKERVKALMSHLKIPSESP